MKAIILHSGTPLAVYDGAYSDIGRRNLVTLPDSLQGYGRLTLKTVLPQTKESDFDLYVDHFSLADFMEMTYDLTITNSNHPLKVPMLTFIFVRKLQQVIILLFLSGYYFLV